MGRSTRSTSADRAAGSSISRDRPQLNVMLACNRHQRIEIQEHGVVQTGGDAAGVESHAGSEVAQQERAH